MTRGEDGERYSSKREWTALIKNMQERWHVQLAYSMAHWEPQALRGRGSVRQESSGWAKDTDLIL